MQAYHRTVVIYVGMCFKPTTTGNLFENKSDLLVRPNKILPTNIFSSKCITADLIKFGSSRFYAGV